MKLRVESVEKALSILDAFSEERPNLTLTELSRETAISKSSLPRLLNSLALYGFITRDDDKSYSLGPGLWRLGALYRRQYMSGEFIRPVLRQLVDETGETASFYVRDRSDRLCLCRENSRKAVRYHLDEGSRLPLDRGAAGRALIAHRPAPDEVFISVGERNPDVAAVAVRILAEDGSLLGALCVSGIVSRFDEERRMEAGRALLRYRDRLSVGE